MNTIPTKLDNYNELKFSKEQGFFDKSPVLRFCIGLFFAFSLFAVLHFREVRIEILEIDSVAPSYIVAQVDFEFLDAEATSRLKLQAVQDVGLIYNLPEKDVRDRRDAFEKYLVRNREWRNYAEKSTFEEMYRGMDSVQNVLLKLRLTDPRTLQKIKDIELPSDHYQTYTAVDSEEAVILPKRIWRYVRKNAFPEGEFQESAVNFILAYFQEQTWQLVEDGPATRVLIRKIQEKQPDKYTAVSAGSRLIDHGDSVTSRHTAMLQAMKKALSDQHNLWHPLTLIGSFILTLILVGICLFYFRINHPRILRSNRKLFLLVTVVVLTFAIAKVTEFFLISSRVQLFDLVRYPIFVPFAAILLTSLLNPSIATFVSGFITILFAITLSFDVQGFLILNLLTAFVVILNTSTLRKRKEVFAVCAKAWIVCIAVIISLHLYQQTSWSLFGVADLVSTGIFMLLIAILVVGLLPLLETGFRIMTDVTLMEYADPNNKLLRRLTIEAPGTYQHSVIVGNLAEVAGLAIGANGLFCRVASLYHDIGKMITPLYFTENQHLGMDIHQLLTPQESAEVIIAHVTEGVLMARKEGLPEQFIDIIKEHHGTTLVYYFYRKQLDKVGGDSSLVDESQFRYSGPKPRSKESAIIMLSDSLEAASRSLNHADEESITELAEALIRHKSEDGQFDHCLLTFEELVVVKKTLIKTLVAFGHSRVKYPSPQKEGENKGPLPDYNA